jgi:hypothetical protein
MQHPPARPEIAVVSPIYDDWEAARRLLADLRQLEGIWEARLTVFLVDDGSPSQPREGDLLGGDGRLRVVLVRLARNCGHQQAIALGLSHAISVCAADLFVVMDGDGEDRPADLPRLVQPLIDDHSLECVLAKRGRRSERLLFRLGHAVYMGLATLLISERIDFGNFSAIRRRMAERVVLMPEALIHLPSTMLKARLPYRKVLVDRGRRYCGESKMSWVSLVIHGLSSVAIFSDRAMTRIILLSAGLLIVCTLCSLVAIGLKLAGHASPGWTTIVLGISTAIVTLTITIGLSSLLSVLGSKMTWQMTPSDLAARLILDTAGNPPSPGYSPGSPAVR